LKLKASPNLSSVLEEKNLNMFLEDAKREHLLREGRVVNNLRKKHYDSRNRYYNS
jgi:hypothetical protein